MGAEIRINVFRGEFALQRSVVGPCAPVANNLNKKNVLVYRDDIYAIHSMTRRRDFL